jgi:hypothetical protein
MITLEQQKEGEESIKTLAHKAWENSTFKEQLVKNPVATIESVTGRSLTLPENKRLIVEDQTDESIIYLNIPPRVNIDSMELTDEQLETIAGGEILVGVGVGILVGAACLAVGYALGKM